MRQLLVYLFISLIFIKYSFSLEPENEYILQVKHSRGLILSDAIIAYKEENKWYLSLTEFSNALAFQLQYISDSQKVYGHLINDQVPFELNYNNCEVIIKKKQLPYECDLVKEYEGDIYVESDLIEKWFPIKNRIEEFKSRIMVETFQDITPIAKLKRKKLAKEKFSKRRKKYSDHIEYKEENNVNSINSLDQSISHVVQKDSLGRSEEHNLYNSNISGQFFGYETHLFLNNKDDQNISNSISLSKKSPKSNLLGNLKAKEVNLLDFTGRSTPLVGSSGNLRGISISNYNFNNGGAF